MKKHLAILSAAVLGFSGVSAAMPASFAVYAEEDAAPASGTCGENLTWELDTETGTLTVSGSGSMEDWNNDESAPWHPSCDKITKVILSDGVTSIGHFAFSYSNNLTSVTIPDSVTRIGNFAFCYCNGLTSVAIPKSVKTIGSGAFYACEALAAVSISEGTEDIGDHSFMLCSALTQIDIPAGVKTVGGEAFSGCSALETVKLPESITFMGSNAFGDTPWMEAKQEKNPIVTEGHILLDGKAAEGDYVIPNGITVIAEQAFAVKTGETAVLTGVTIPEGVTEIAPSTFADCIALHEVKLPESLKSIGAGAFQMYLANAYAEDSPVSQLEKITIPAGVERIDEGAFNLCTGLKEITILNPECRISANLAINNMNHPTPGAPDGSAYIQDYSGVIRGYDGSTAEAYAEEHGFAFQSLGEAPAAPELEPTLLGDADESGEVDVSDAVILARYLTEDKNAEITDQGLANADADSSGKVDSEDVIRIVKMVAKLV